MIQFLVRNVREDGPGLREMRVAASDPKDAAEESARQHFRTWAWEDSGHWFPMSLAVRKAGDTSEDVFAVNVRSEPVFEAEHNGTQGAPRDE